jgi:cyclic dehypoxanthinyl futalosine synthase
MRSDRLSRDEAIRFLVESPLVALMARAHAFRMELHPRNDVTFVVDTNPNYTNVCVTDCTFCSFYRRPGAADAYLLPAAVVAEQVATAQAAGATTVLIQGGHHPQVRWRYLDALLMAIRQRAPGIHLHPFSPSEVVHVASTSGLSVRQVLQRMWDRGVRTMPGGGAEILVDRVRRKLAPKKLRSQEWLDCMRVAHEIGMRTSATMTYGHVEAPEDIVDHLLALRQLQDETGGFYAFIPWSFKPGKSPLARRVPTARSPSFYLRVIALSRLVLDNVPHIQASWFGEGVRAGQLALVGGADDFGGVLLEENVLREARHAVATSIDAVVKMIDEAGFAPVQRSTLYETVWRYDGLPEPTRPMNGSLVHHRPGRIPILVV